MKRIFPLVVLALAMLFLFAAQVEGAKAYTHWELISTDTLSGTEACTLFTQTQRVFPDSSYWHFGFSTDQTNDSVEFDIDAYWSPFEVIFKKGTRTDSISGPWTVKQDVVAQHKADDWVLTMYSGEAVSKYFEWCRLIIAGLVGENGVDAIIKTYIGYRKFWEKE